MKSKNWISLSLAGVLCAGGIFTTSSCAKKFADNDQSLEVYLCKTGYGSEWLEKALETFKETPYVKEKYPEFQYKLQTNDEFGYGQSHVLSGATTLDLVFASTFSPSTIETPGNNGEKSILANLNDVFNGKIPNFYGDGYEKNADGVEWTYAEKLEKANPLNFQSIGFQSYDEQSGEYVTDYYYGLRGLSTYGIFYNKTKLQEYGFISETEDGKIVGLPRTTDELETFAVAIANAGYTPFVLAKDTGYWTRVQNVWWAQYDGMESFDRYFQGEYKNEEGEWVQGIEVLDSKGRLLANEIMEKLLWYDREPRLIHPESSALDFTTAQSYLISGIGLIQANGDWFDYEMRSLQGQEGADNEVRMMPGLMISDIIEVLPDKSVADDKELSAVVGAMNDGVATLSGEYEGVAYEITQADFDRIKEAHGLYNMGETNTPSLIPCYSTAIELAKDFLRYMATDEFCRQYMDTTVGASPAHYYDVKNADPELYAKFTKMQHDRLQFVKGKQSILAYKTCNYPLMYRTGYSVFGSGFEYSYMATNAKDRKTAARLIESQKANYKANNNELWDMLFVQAGLK